MKKKKLPAWARFSAVVDSRIQFRFIDRIRILFRGSVILQHGLLSEKFPGRTIPVLEVYVKPIKKK